MAVDTDDEKIATSTPHGEKPMRKKSLFTVAMMISLAGAAHAAGSEALPIPPGLEVGQLPLRFREPVKADAPEKIVADVWRRSNDIRSQTSLRI